MRRMICLLLILSAVLCAACAEGTLSVPEAGCVVTVPGGWSVKDQSCVSPDGSLTAAFSAGGVSLEELWAGAQASYAAGDAEAPGEVVVGSRYWIWQTDENGTLTASTQVTDAETLTAVFTAAGGWVDLRTASVLDLLGAVSAAAE